MAVLPRTPEIEKYIATLAKDPKSKVFAALAEAYRKAGALDEAIHLCQDGLKRNPNYLSGVVALGRCYHDKGMKVEAREQFEKVVKVSPDNVIAQRILGDIYTEEGKKAEAIKAFKLILALNPKDAEVQEHLDVLEGRKAPPAAVVPAVAPVAVPAAIQAQAPSPPQPKPVEAKPVVAQVPAQPPLKNVQPKAPAPPAPAPVEDQLQSIDFHLPPASEPAPPPQKTATMRASASEIPGASSPSTQAGHPPEAVRTGTSAQSSGDGFEDFEEAFKEFDAGEKPAQAPITGDTGSPDRSEPSESPVTVTSQPLSFEGGPLAEEGPVVNPPAAKMPGDQGPKVGIILDELLGGAQDQAPRPEPKPRPVVKEAPPRTSMTTSTLADLYFKQGYYDKALAIYQAMLSEGQDSPELRDKMEAIQRKISETAIQEPPGKTSPPPASSAAELQPKERAAQPPPGSGNGRSVQARAVPKMDKGNNAVEENIRRLSQWLDKIKAGG